MEREGRLEGRFPKEVKFLPDDFYDDLRRFATDYSLSAQVVTRERGGGSGSSSSGNSGNHNQPAGDYLVVKGPESGLTECVGTITERINYYFPD